MWLQPPATNFPRVGLVPPTLTKRGIAWLGSFLVPVDQEKASRKACCANIPTRDDVQVALDYAQVEATELRGKIQAKDNEIVVSHSATIE